MSLNDNPLWALLTPGSSPDFSAIRPEHALPAISALIDRNREQLQTLLGNDNGAADWDSLIEPLEIIEDDLSRVWSPISHLFGVCNSPEWQAAYNACLPLMTGWGLEMAQNRPLFEAYKAIAASSGFGQLSTSRQRVIENAIRDFRHGGADLRGEQREQFTQSSLRLSELQSEFQQNLLDSTQAWSLLIEDRSRLDGMQADALQRAQQRAEQQQSPGWLLSLDFPSYDAVMSHARDRELRRQLYTAFARRASADDNTESPHDNAPLIDEILALRSQQAELLGFPSYAQLALEGRMAKSTTEVESFLLDLASKALPRAQAEIAKISELARAMDGLESLQAWDLRYYGERLREQSLGLNEEELRPYFELESVIGGMLDLVAGLYGVSFEQVHDRSTWHADVRVYRVATAGETIGHFYLDPYARDGKRSGAWMDDGQARHITTSKRQLPVAYLVCNFTPPGADGVALMTHDELLTLYHEFGHGLHHLLTEVDEAGVSGISGVAWDAVELPSQFMENWCYEPSILRRFARHYRSGEALPEAMIEQLRAARQFLTGMATLRQVEFSLFDLRLHSATSAQQPVAVRELLAQVRQQVSVIETPEFNRFENSFSHVFAGGYAAGYYSYKWAEVLSSDAFAAFEEEGLDNTETATRFRDSVLARGGSQAPDQLFEMFRGRAPSIDALLRHEGLDTNTETAA